MRFLEFQKKLVRIEKPFYTISDLEKTTGLQKSSLVVILSRWVKQGLLLRPLKGVFLLPEDKDKLPEIANQLYAPSYLSFESALSRYGILSQSPYTITFATTNRSKRMLLLDTETEYRQMKKEFFTGFSKENNLFIATPAKALLDTLYLYSLGKLSISLEELDISPVNKKELVKLSLIFPKKVRVLINDLLGK